MIRRLRAARRLRGGRHAVKPRALFGFFAQLLV